MIEYRDLAIVEGAKNGPHFCFPSEPVRFLPSLTIGHNGEEERNVADQKKE